jgi:hypothetical protein
VSLQMFQEFSVIVATPMQNNKTKRNLALPVMFVTDMLYVIFHFRLKYFRTEQTHNDSHLYSSGSYMHGARMFLETAVQVCMQY